VQQINKFISTFGYVGRISFAPGTMGTIAACLIALIINMRPDILMLVTFITFLIGTVSSHCYSKFIINDDPSDVVIDEVVGVWFLIALLQLAFIQINDISIPHALDFIIKDHHFLFNIITVLASFVFFRIFDIKKPWPICYCEEKIHGGLGIMLDDIAAAVVGFIVMIGLLVIGFGGYLIVTHKSLI